MSRRWEWNMVSIRKRRRKTVKEKDMKEMRGKERD
jgi:hypothetical protein